VFFSDGSSLGLSTKSIECWLSGRYWGSVVILTQFLTFEIGERGVI
jgi:hypothetical protein